MSLERRIQISKIPPTVWNKVKLPGLLVEADGLLMLPLFLASYNVMQPPATKESKPLLFLFSDVSRFSFLSLLSPIQLSDTMHPVIRSWRNYEKVNKNGPGKVSWVEMQLCIFSSCPGSAFLDGHKGNTAFFFFLGMCYMCRDVL